MTDDSNWTSLISKLQTSPLEVAQQGDSAAANITNPDQKISTNFQNELPGGDYNPFGHSDIFSSHFGTGHTQHTFTGNNPFPTDTNNSNFKGVFSMLDPPLAAKKLNFEVKTARSDASATLIRHSFVANSKLIIFQNLENEIEILSTQDYSVRIKLDTPLQVISDMSLYSKGTSHYLCCVFPCGVYAYFVEFSESSDKIEAKAILKSEFSDEFKELKVQWKNESNFAIIANTTVLVFQIPMKQEGDDSQAQLAKPVSYIQEEKITDFAFSQRNDLLYLCLENGAVRLINSQDGSRVREFIAFSKPEICKQVLVFRNLLPEESKQESGEIKDILITASSNGEIKTWDLSEWDEAAQSFQCIDTLPEQQGVQYILFDLSKSFFFVFRGKKDESLRVLAHHIDSAFYRWTENFSAVKKQKKFFDYTEEFVFPNVEEVHDLVIVNVNQTDSATLLENEELNLEEEGQKKELQEEYCDSKTILEIYYATASGLKKAGIECNKIYQFLIQELEKSKPENFSKENYLKSKQNDIFPPGLPPFIQSIYEEQKSVPSENALAKEHEQERMVWNNSHGIPENPFEKYFNTENQQAKDPKIEENGVNDILKKIEEELLKGKPEAESVQEKGQEQETVAEKQPTAIENPLAEIENLGGKVDVEESADVEEKTEEKDVTAEKIEDKTEELEKRDENIENLEEKLEEKPAEENHGQLEENQQQVEVLQSQEEKPEEKPFEESRNQPEDDLQQAEVLQSQEQLPSETQVLGSEQKDETRKEEEKEKELPVSQKGEDEQQKENDQLNSKEEEAGDQAIEVPAQIETNSEVTTSPQKEFHEAFVVEKLENEINEEQGGATEPIKIQEVVEVPADNNGEKDHLSLLKQILEANRVQITHEEPTQQNKEKDNLSLPKQITEEQPPSKIEEQQPLSKPEEVHPSQNHQHETQPTNLLIQKDIKGPEEPQSQPIHLKPIATNETTTNKKSSKSKKKKDKAKKNDNPIDEDPKQNDKPKFVPKKIVQKPQQPIKHEEPPQQNTEMKANNFIASEPKTVTESPNKTNTSPKDQQIQKPTHYVEEVKEDRRVTQQTQTQPTAAHYQEPITRNAQPDVEAIIENKFQAFMDGHVKYLDSKFGKIEQIIESKIEERMNKFQMSFVTENLEGSFDAKLNKMFSHAFENQVTPSIEKYLLKTFESVNGTFEKGHRYFIDKLNIEQSKSNYIRDTMNDVLKNFLQISNAVTESAVSNQSTFNRLEVAFQEKKNQIGRLLDQLSDMITKQQELQKRLENTEKTVIDNMTKLRDSLQSQVQQLEEKWQSEIKKKALGAKPEDSKLNNEQNAKAEIRSADSKSGKNTAMNLQNEAKTIQLQQLLDIGKDDAIQASKDQQQELPRQKPNTSVISQGAYPGEIPQQMNMQPGNYEQQFMPQQINPSGVNQQFLNSRVVNAQQMSPQQGYYPPPEQQQPNPRLMNSQQLRQFSGYPQQVEPQQTSSQVVNPQQQQPRPNSQQGYPQQVDPYARMTSSQPVYTQNPQQGQFSIGETQSSFIQKLDEKSFKNFMDLYNLHLNQLTNQATQRPVEQIKPSYVPQQMTQSSNYGGPSYQMSFLPKEDLESKDESRNKTITFPQQPIPQTSHLISQSQNLNSSLSRSNTADRFQPYDQNPAFYRQRSEVPFNFEELLQSQPGYGYPGNYQQETELQTPQRTTTTSQSIGYPSQSGNYYPQSGWAESHVQNNLRIPNKEQNSVGDSSAVDYGKLGNILLGGGFGQEGSIIRGGINPENYGSYPNAEMKDGYRGFGPSSMVMRKPDATINDD